MSRLPKAISDLPIAEKYELLNALWEDLAQHAAKQGNTPMPLAAADGHAQATADAAWEKIKADLLKRLH